MFVTRDLDTATIALGKRAIIIEAVTLALAILSLSLRLWARKINKRSLCLNDYLIVLALPFTLGLFATSVITIVSEAQVVQIQSLLDIETSIKSIVASDYLWAAAITFIKTSILHLYISIFPQRSLHTLCYIVMSAVVSFGIAVIFTQSFICKPFEKHWDVEIAGECGNFWASVLSESVINATINLIIICIPMPTLWRLKTSLHRKILLTVIFGVGIITITITILRFIAATSANPQTVLSQVALWTNLEAILGIQCACLPVMWPALNRLLHLATGTTSKKSSVRSQAPLEMSSTVAWLRQQSQRGGNASKGVRETEEDRYPLADTAAWKNHRFLGPGARSEKVDDGLSEESIARDRADNTELPERGILVRSDWSVSRE